MNAKSTTNKRTKLLSLLAVLVLLALLLPLPPARAQLDVVHYIPPLVSYTWDQGRTSTSYLFLSTPSTTPVTVTVVDGAGATIWSGTVSNAAPVSVNVTSMTLTATSQLNSIRTNGLIVTADAPIYANIRSRESQQSGSLTAKGLAALGTRFRAGFMRKATRLTTHPNTRAFLSR